MSAPPLIAAPFYPRPLHDDRGIRSAPERLPRPTLPAQSLAFPASPPVLLASCSQRLQPGGPPTAPLRAPGEGDERTGSHTRSTSVGPPFVLDPHATHRPSLPPQVAGHLFEGEARSSGRAA